MKDMLVVAKLKKVSLKNLWDLCNLKKQLRREVKLQI